MNKEILENKIAEILEIEEDDKRIAFEIFKEKLAESLNIGEAIKIDGIGVFQLKEKYSHQPLPSGSKNTKNFTLLFSPETQEQTEDSLFIYLDIDDKTKDETEFSDDILQVGIGKKLITDIDDLSNLDDNIPSSNKIIEEKVMGILNNYSKIKDFDLWDDHLKSKESKTIINDEIDLEEDFELVEQESDIEEEKSILEEPFEELNDDELLDGYIEDSQINIEEIKEVGSIDEKESNEIIEPIDELDEPISDLTDEHFNEETDEEIESTEKDNEEESSGTKKSVMDEIELELQKEDYKDTSQIQDDINVEEIIDDQVDETIPSVEIQSEDENNILEKNVLENEDTRSISGMDRVPRKKNKIWLILLAAFVLIAAVSVYYLFFNNGINTYGDLNEKASTHESVNDEEQAHTELAAEDDTRLKEQNETNSIPEVKEDIKTEQIDIPVNDKPEKRINENKIKSDEREIAKNIYYDGYVYNVQISSWKSRDIAEREVNRLLNKGFPAFIIKAYIPKFDGTWHRVRIGPYTSLEEAKIAQSKLAK